MCVEVEGYLLIYSQWKVSLLTFFVFINLVADSPAIVDEGEQFFCSQLLLAE